MRMELAVQLGFRGSEVTREITGLEIEGQRESKMGNM